MSGPQHAPAAFLDDSLRYLLHVFVRHSRRCRVGSAVNKSMRLSRDAGLRRSKWVLMILFKLVFELDAVLPTACVYLASCIRHFR